MPITVSFFGSRKTSSVDNHRLSTSSEISPDIHSSLVLMNEKVKQNIANTLQEKDFFSALINANLCIKKLDKTRLIELKHITKKDFCQILQGLMKISFKLKSAQAITHLSIQELISKDKLK